MALLMQEFTYSCRQKVRYAQKAISTHLNENVCHLLLKTSYSINQWYSFLNELKIKVKAKFKYSETENCRFAAVFCLNNATQFVIVFISCMKRKIVHTMLLAPGE